MPPPDPFDPWNLPQASPLPSPMKSPARTPMNKQPCCIALYDFDAENPGELSFKGQPHYYLLAEPNCVWRNTDNTLFTVYISRYIELKYSSTVYAKPVTTFFICCSLN